MSTTRAVFASIGASAALVAAAALSLLAVSAVFAFGGWSDPVAESASQSALVLGDDDVAARQVARVPPVVLPARARPKAPPAVSPSADRPARRVTPAAVRPATQPTSGAPAAMPTPTLSAPTTQAARQPPAAADRRTAGDGVRKAGDDVSAKVENVGTALSRATEPLAAPVSAAVQMTLNLIAELLRGTTNGLGGTLDNVLAPK